MKKKVLISASRSSVKAERYVEAFRDLLVENSKNYHFLKDYDFISVTELAYNAKTLDNKHSNFVFAIFIFTEKCDDEMLIQECQWAKQKNEAGTLLVLPEYVRCALHQKEQSIFGELEKFWYFDDKIPSEAALKIPTAKIARLVMSKPASNFFSRLKRQLEENENGGNLMNTNSKSGGGNTTINTGGGNYYDYRNGTNSSSNDNRQYNDNRRYEIHNNSIYRSSDFDRDEFDNYIAQAREREESFDDKVIIKNIDIIESEIKKEKTDFEAVGKALDVVGGVLDVGEKLADIIKPYLPVAVAAVMTIFGG
jgi:hypothetical protein